MTKQVEIELTKEESKQLQEGQSIYEMTKTSGWKVIEKWLENMAYHSWVDPRSTQSEKEWMWQELNAYHAASNAQELLNSITEAVNQAEYLQKVKTGEIKRKRMILK